MIEYVSKRIYLSNSRKQMQLLHIEMAQMPNKASFLFLPTCLHLFSENNLLAPSINRLPNAAYLQVAQQLVLLLQIKMNIETDQILPSCACPTSLGPNLHSCCLALFGNWWWWCSSWRWMSRVLLTNLTISLRSCTNTPCTSQFYYLRSCPCNWAPCTLHLATEHLTFLQFAPCTGQCTSQPHQLAQWYLALSSLPLDILHLSDQTWILSARHSTTVNTACLWF